MMRLQPYAGFSFWSTISAVYYAFSCCGQFYPAMVYLSTSKICFILLVNTGFVLMCILWQLVKKVFLGTLRETEVERLNEYSWCEIVEILSVVTIFRYAILATTTVSTFVKYIFYASDMLTGHQ